MTLRITHTQICTLLHAAADVIPEPQRTYLLERSQELENEPADKRIAFITAILSDHYE